MPQSEQNGTHSADPVALVPLVAAVADGRSNGAPGLSSHDTVVADIPGWTPDGVDLLRELREELTTYVVFPTEESADAVTLWIAATHAQIAWQHAPRLAVCSPEKRCGKSRLMDMASETVHNALITVNASPPAIYRSIELKDPPTLLVDEADTIFGKKASDAHEDLRALLNAGHQRNRPALRYDVTARRVVAHPTFSMSMLAGIGDLPDTIMDRAVVIRMRRRAAGESVRPYRTRRDQPRLNRLRDRLAAWLEPFRAWLAGHEPRMPVEDRAADTWEPLVAISDLVGGDWPTRARHACEFMVSAEEGTGEAVSLGLRLLADLRDVFGDAVHLHTSDILEGLHEIEDAPWGDFYGRPFNPHDLSKMLRPYGVVPVNVRVGQISKKGYKKDHLWDVWGRYLPGVPALPQNPATSATPATVQLSTGEFVAPYSTSSAAERYNDELWPPNWDEGNPE